VFSVNLSNKINQMNINTKATGITITPSISEYVEKKVGMLEKFFRGSFARSEPPSFHPNSMT
jgi:hypothetical protein